MITNLLFKKYSRLTNFVRIIKLRFLGCKIGKKCNIGKVKVIGHERIKIGNYVTIEDNVRLTAYGNANSNNKILINIYDKNFIGYGSVIDANKYIEINSFCMIGPYCFITDSNHVHQLNDNHFSDLGGVYKEVLIKRNCWLSAQCIVLPGVIINENSVVAANSTVLKDINRCTLNAGSPSIEKKNKNTL